jgi:cell division protein FtsN
LIPAAETGADAPAATDDVSAEEASAEKIDEAQFEKEELAAEAGDEPEGASAPEAVKGVVADGRFTVQVGSYNQPGQAEARASAVRAAGFEARVAAVEILKKGTWYRVQAGRFQTREQAALYEKSLRAAGAAETTFVAESTN